VDTNQSEDNQSSDEEDPDDDPIPDLIRRSERVPVPRRLLQPNFRGQTYEEDTHVSTQEYVPHEAVTLRQLLQPTCAEEICKVETNHLITQVHPPNTLEYEPHEAVVLGKAFAEVYHLSKGLKHSSRTEAENQPQRN